MCRMPGDAEGTGACSSAPMQACVPWDLSITLGGRGSLLLSYLQGRGPRDINSIFTSGHYISFKNSCSSSEANQNPYISRLKKLNFGQIVANGQI